MMDTKITITLEELKPIHEKLNGQGLKVLKEMWILKTRKQYPNNPYPSAKDYSTSRKPSNRLTNQICDFITLLGHHAERINTMGVMRDNRKNVTDVLGRTKTIGSTEWTRGGTTPGSADISATIYGFKVAIEVKIGSDKQSDKQKRYQKHIEDAGGVYYIAKDFQTFYDYILRLIAKLKRITDGIRLSS